MKFWKKKPASDRQISSTNREYVAEALEARILYSGAPAPTEAPDAPVEEVAAGVSGQSEANFASTEDFDSGLSHLESESGLSDAVVLTSFENLSLEEIKSLESAAIERWKETGLTGDQLDALELIEISVVDLEGLALGAVEGNEIYLDWNAAGYDWFIDETPWADEEFSYGESYTTLTASSLEASRGVDMLSVMMHEMGHIIGLEDIYESIGKTDVMFGFFEGGQRRLITEGRAEGAEALSLEGVHYVTHTWDGGGADSNWNTQQNWNPDTLPDDDATAFDSFIFEGTTGLTPNLNFAGDGAGYNTGSITFQEDAGAYTITGNKSGGGSIAFDLLGGTGTSDPGASEVSNYSTETQTFDLGFRHRSEYNHGVFFNAINGDIVVNGAITELSGDVPVMKPVTITGSQTVTFNGNNDYDDPTYVGSSLLDDFQSYTVGNMSTDRTGGVWEVNGTATDQIESDSGNKFLAFGWEGGNGTTTSRGAYRAIPAISDTEIRSVAFDARIDSDAASGIWTYGVTDFDSPLTASGPSGANIRAGVQLVSGTVDDGKMNLVAGGVTLAADLDIGQWYRIEMAIDLSDNSFDVYLEGVKLNGTPIAFDSATTNDLDRFVVVGGGGGTQSQGRFAGHLDNLTSPSSGNLILNGTHTGSGGFTINSGSTFGGTGSTATSVKVESMATLAPGDGGIGTLSVGDLDIDGVLQIEVSGATTAGTDYDQVVVTGTVDIDGATLKLVGSIAGSPAVGTVMTLISNDGTDAVTGTFAGLAEGSALVSEGHSYTVSYAGGTDNNDVVLTYQGVVETEVTLVGGDLVITDVNGGTSDDDLTIADDGTYYIITDTNLNVAAAGITGSVQNGTNSVKVLKSEVTGGLIVNALGASADTVTISSDLTFAGDVTINAESINLNRDITTTGDITFNGDVVQGYVVAGDDVRLTAQNVTFNGDTTLLTGGDEVFELDVSGTATNTVGHTFNQNGGYLDLSNASTFVNEGSFLTGGNLAVPIFSSGSEGGRFTNNGTFTHNGTQLRLWLVLTNNGTLTIDNPSGASEIQFSPGGGGNGLGGVLTNNGMLNINEAAARFDGTGSIVNADGGTINVNGASTTFAESLTVTNQSGGTINLEGVTTQVDGTTLTNDAGGAINLRAVKTLNLTNSGEIINSGTTTWVSGQEVTKTLTGGGDFINNGLFDHAHSGGSDNFVIAGLSDFINASGATFDLGGNGEIQIKANSRFDNSGTLIKTGGAGTDGGSTSGVYDSGSFHNLDGGSVVAEVGVLHIGAVGPNTSHANASWTARANATNMGRGYGDVRIGGTWEGTIAGSSADGGHIEVTTTSNSAFLQQLTVGAGGLALNVTGDGFIWDDGTIDTAAGNLTNLGLLAVQGATTKTLQNGKLINASGATITIQGATGDLAVSNATIQNLSGGEINLTGGAISLTGSELQNAGAFNYEQGTVNLTGAIDVFRNQSGGTLTFSAASTNLMEINGSGRIINESGAVTKLTGAGGIDFNTTGVGFENDGTFTWSSSGSIDLQQAGSEFQNDGTFVVSGSANRAFNGVGTFTNNGTFNHQASGDDNLQGLTSGGSFVNNGLFDIRGIGDFEIRDGYSFTNTATGTLLKSANNNSDPAQFFSFLADPGAGTIGSTGTVEVTIGRFRVSTSLNSNTDDVTLTEVSGTILTDGRWVATSTGGTAAILDLQPAQPGGIVTIGENAEVILTGAASQFVQLNNFLAQIDGALTLNGDENLDAASNVTVGSTGTLAGEGGTLTGNLTVDADGTITPGVGAGDVDTLNVAGNLTLNGNYNVDVDGANSDLIDVNGAVAIAGNLSFNLVSDPTAPLITVIDNDGTSDATTGAFTSLNGVATSLADGAEILIGTKTYKIFYNGGDGNDVVLVDAATPATVYVDDAWATGVNGGQTIDDADLGTDNDQNAVFGVNAFATIADALDVVGTDGVIIVNSGNYSETVTLTGTQTLEITGPDTTGAVTIESLSSVAGTTISIEGTSSLTVGAGTIAGSIEGAAGGSLIKSTVGTLVLSGTGSYTGATTVSAGILELASDDAVDGTSHIQINGASTLQLRNVKVDRPIFANSSGFTGLSSSAIHVVGGSASEISGAVTLQRSTSIKTRINANTSLEVTGGITGNYSLALYDDSSGAPGITVSTNPVNIGANTFSGHGLTLNVAGNTAGVFRADWGNVITLGVDNVFTSPPALLIANSSNASGKLDLNGHDLEVTSVTAGQVSSSAIVTDSTGAATLTVTSSSPSTFSGVITGGLQLNKAGTSDFTLTGNNSYTGVTTITAGTLALSGSGDIDQSSEIAVSSGATFDVSARTGGIYAFAGDVTGSGTVNGNLTVGATGNLQPGANSGDDAGTLSITGDATLSGDFDFGVDGSSADLLEVTGGVTLGGTLTVTGNGNAADDVDVYTVVSNDDVDGVVGTFSNLTQNGVSTVAIDGVNYRIIYNGGDGNDVLLVNAAPTTVYVNSDWADVDGTLVDGDDEKSGQQDAVIGYTAFASINAAISALGTNSGTIVVNSGVYSSEAVDLTIPGTDLDITLQFVEGDSEIGSLATGVNDRGILGGFDGDHPAGVTLTLGALDNGLKEIKGVVSGAGGITKVGTSYLKLSGDNTYSGITTVERGRLYIGHNNALGAAGEDSKTIVKGADGSASSFLYLDSATPLTINETLNLNATSAGRVTVYSNSTQVHTLAGPIDVSSSGTLVQFNSNGSGGMTITGDISGTMSGGSVFLRGGSKSAANHLQGSVNLSGSSLLKTDDGTWTVGASGAGQTYSWNDIQVARGSVKLGAANILNPTRSIRLDQNDNAGATLDLNNFDQTAAGIIFNNGGSPSVGSVLTGTGTLTLNGDISYSTDNNTMGGLISGNLDLGGATRTVTVGDSTGTDSELTISAVISNGGISKVGDGTLILSGDSTYTGVTNVNAGALLVTGDNGSATGAVTVANGAVLAGSGTLGGIVTVVTGADLQPGVDGVGTLTISSNTTINGELAFDIDGASTDLLKVEGDLTAGDDVILGGTITFNVVTDPTESLITIIDNDGTADKISTAFSNYAEGDSVVLGSKTYTISYSGGDGNDVVLFEGAAETDVALSGGVLTISDIVTENADDITISYDSDSNEYVIKDPNLILKTTGLTAGQFSRPDANTVRVDASVVTSIVVQTANPTVATEADTVTISSWPANVGGNVEIHAEVIRIGADVTTSGDQTFDGAVTLTSDVTLTGANITFGGFLNSDAEATKRNLVVNTSGGGVTRFESTVGGIFDLATLTTNADGSVVLNGSVTTSGFQTYNNTVSLSGSRSLSGSTITLVEAVTNGGSNLTVNSNGINILGGIDGGGGSVILTASSLGIHVAEDITTSGAGIIKMSSIAGGSTAGILIEGDLTTEFGVIELKGRSVSGVGVKISDSEVSTSGAGGNIRITGRTAGASSNVQLEIDSSSSVIATDGSITLKTISGDANLGGEINSGAHALLLESGADLNLNDVTVVGGVIDLLADDNVNITSGTSISGPASTLGNVVLLSENFEGFTQGDTTASLNDIALDNGWVNLHPETLDFVSDKAGTPSGNTGPSSDHTLGNSSGTYLYMETSSPGEGEFAQLLSPVVNLSGEANSGVEFYYHMYGEHIGSLKVEGSSDGGATWAELLILDGEQGNEWKQALIDLSQFDGSDTFQLRLTGVRGDGYQGDISLDDFRFFADSGDLLVEDFENGAEFGQGPTSGSRPQQVLGGGWTNVISSDADEIDWIPDRGGTPSANTGPGGGAGIGTDHTTGTSGGMYLYIETSGGVGSSTLPRPTAQLYTPAIDLSEHSVASVEFYYHMFDNALGEMGTLNVYGSADGGETWSAELFTQSGNQGDQWHQAIIDLSSFAGSENFVMRIEGVAGTGYAGDILIDDFRITGDPVSNTTVTIVADADKDGSGGAIAMEDGSTVNAGDGNVTLSADGDITVSSVATTSTITATSTSGGIIDGGDAGVDLVASKFIGITAGGVGLGGNALETQVSNLEANGGSGGVAISNTGSLTIGGTGADLGVTGTGTVSISSTANLTLATDTTVTGFGIDLSADGNVDLLAGSQVENVGSGMLLNEDFESFTEGSETAGAVNIALGNRWVNVQGSDQIDWSPDAGGTTSGSTGPGGGANNGTDHTTGTAAGKYLYIETSDPVETDDTAELHSPAIDLSAMESASLEFYYHMVGVDPEVGSLKVFASIDGGMTWSNELFSVSGSQGNEWKQVVIDLGAFVGNSQVVLRFDGIAGDVGTIAVPGNPGYRGDIALDDISVTAVGKVTLRADANGSGGGAVNMAATSILEGGSSNIEISADGDVTVSSVTTTGDLAISSVSGEVNDHGVSPDISAVTLTIDGVAAPGQSGVGTLEVSANLELNSGANLELTNSGVHDLIDVDGEVSLSGDLNLTLSYAPAAGEMIVIVDNDGTADAITGTFTGFPDNHFFELDFGGNTYLFQIHYTTEDGSIAGNNVVLESFGVAETEVALSGGVLTISDINTENADAISISYDSSTEEYVIADPNLGLKTSGLLDGEFSRPDVSTVRVKASLVTSLVVTTANPTTTTETDAVSIDSLPASLAGDLEIHAETINIGTDVTTTGAQTYDGSVNLDGNVTFTGTDIAFQSKQNGSSTVTIDSGETLSVNGNLLFGERAVNGLTTNVTMTGGGALVVTGATVEVGVSSSSSSNSNTTTVDLAGLGSVMADVTNFRVGYGQQNRSTLTLSDTTNTITANVINVSNSGGLNTGASMMILGAGTNVLNTDDLDIGISKGVGEMTFASQASGSAGTLTLRAKDGVGAADITVGENTNASTGAHNRGTLNLDGHSVDVLADSLVIAHRTRPGYHSTQSPAQNGQVSGTVSFDAGTFVVNHVDMANRSGNFWNAATAILNIGGGVFTINDSISFTTVADGRVAVGTVNLSDGVLDLTDGAMLKGDGTAVFNFTGGTLKDADTIGFATSQSGGVLQIGADGLADSTTVEGDFTSSGSIEIDLNGAAGAGVAGGHDQIIVANGDGDGALDLTGSTLSLTLNFAAAAGQNFVLVDNDTTVDPVTGTFAGMPEGHIFERIYSGDRYVFQIHYNTEDGSVAGNNVVLESFGVAETSVEIDGSGNLVVSDINNESADNLDISVQNISGIDYYVIKDTNPTPLVLTTSLAAGDATQVGPGEIHVKATSVTGGIVVGTANPSADTDVDVVTVTSLPALIAGDVTIHAETINLLANVTSAGNQIYDGAVVLGADVALSGANVTFQSTVDSDSNSPARTLVVNTSGGGVTSFDGNVGSGFALASLVTNADGIVDVGARITTTGAQTYNDAVILSASATFTGGAITFVEALTGSGNNMGVDAQTVDVQSGIDGQGGFIRLNASSSTGTGIHIGGDVVTSGNGYITMTGRGGGAGNPGVWIEADLTTEVGDIILNGTSGADQGVLIAGSARISNAGGDITITGSGGDDSTTFAINSEAGSQILTTDGAINIITTSGSARIGGAVDAGAHVLTIDIAEDLNLIDASVLAGMINAEAGNDVNMTSGTTVSGSTAGGNVVLLSQNFESFPLGSTTAQDNNIGLAEGWTNAHFQSDTLDFVSDKGGTPSGDTGPSIDHTLGTSSGTYLYLEVSGPSAGEFAYLESPVLDLSGETNAALEFYYHMYGADIGALSLEGTTDGGATWIKLFQEDGNQGNQWNKGVVDLSQFDGAAQFQLRVKAERGSDYRGDIALDDFRFYADSGDLLVENFESFGQGPTTNRPQQVLSNGWTNVVNSSSTVPDADELDWSPIKGPTPSGNTGASADHTTGDSSGTYLFIETSDPVEEGEIAVLYSPSVDLSAHATASVEFFYHMWGDHMGDLKIYGSSDGGYTWSSELFSVSGDQGNQWNQASIDLSSFAGSSNFILRVDGIAGAVTPDGGAGYMSDISLDDFRFYGDPVENAHISFTADSDGDANGTGGAITMADGASILGGDGNVKLSADEDVIIGSITTTAKITVTSSTGMILDGGDTGVDLEAGALVLNAGGGAGTAANRLDTKVNNVEAIAADGGIYLSNSGDLTIGEAGADLGIAADKGTVSIETSNDLFVAEDTTVRGEVVDLSADNNVNLLAGAKIAGSQAEVLLEESFDSFATGSTTPGQANIPLVNGWTNVQGTDQLDWTPYSGKTPSGASYNLGPDRDHTSGSGKYLFIESSDSVSDGQTAVLHSPVLDLSNYSSGTASFYYYMFGVDSSGQPFVGDNGNPQMGTINVYGSSDGGATWSPVLFTRSGNQADEWLRADVDLSGFAGSSNVILRIDGVAGDVSGSATAGFASDIAIDDFKVTAVPIVGPVNVTITADADGDADGSGGATDMADTATIVAVGGSVDLVADGDIIVSSVSTEGNVSLTSGSGEIRDRGVNPDITAGSLTVNGVEAPGLGDIGTMNVDGDFNLASGGLQVQIDGETSADLVNVTGAVIIGGTSTLSLDEINDGPVLDGTIVTLIANDGSDAVQGTFAATPEGSVVVDADGNEYTISYSGGDGNDVVLFAGKAETHVDLTGGVLTITDINADSTDTLQITYNSGDNTYTIRETANANLVISTTGLTSAQVTRPDARSVIVDASAVTGLVVDTTGVTADVEANDRVTITGDVAIPLSGDFAITADDVVITAGTQIAVTGAGTVTINANQQIDLLSGSSITTDQGDIILNANLAGNTVGDATGIDLNNATIGSNGGNITLNGSASGAGTVGVDLRGGSTVTTTNGTVDITAGSGDLSLVNTDVSGGGKVTLSADDNFMLDAASSITSTGDEIEITVDQVGAADAAGSSVELLGSVNAANQVYIAGGADRDQFNIVPSVFSVINIDGGSPSYVDDGDILNTLNAINPQRVVLVDGFSGTFTFGGGQKAINYEDIERDNIPSLEIDIPISQRLFPTTVNGTFTDFGLTENHILTVDWKDPDGGISTFNAPSFNDGLAVGMVINSTTDGAQLRITSIDPTTGEVSFTVSHTYQQDGLYNVAVSVTDPTNARVEASTVAEVYFLAPFNGNAGFFSFADLPGRLTLNGISGLFQDLRLSRLFATDFDGNDLDLSNLGQNPLIGAYVSLEGDVRVVVLTGVESVPDDFLTALNNSILNGTPLDLSGNVLSVDSQEVLQMITDLILIDVDGVEE